MKLPILTIALSLSLFAVSCKEKNGIKKENTVNTEKVSGNIKTEELKTEIFIHHTIFHFLIYTTFRALYSYHNSILTYNLYLFL